MKLTQNQTKEYQVISKEEFGKEISYEMAQEELLKAVVFVMAVRNITN